MQVADQPRAFPVHANQQEKEKAKVKENENANEIDIEAALARLQQQRNALLDEIAKVIVGQEQVVKLLLAAIFSGGHALLVGVPGLAKTALVKALAASLELPFKRIQFTPDMMPSDITGTHVLVDGADGRRQFEFQKGPLFASVILADEINRTPPKTQAALLEAMQERQVTVGNNTFRLPEPFFVIATQNPIEQEGTYELPEAQLDRFMFDVHVDYPSLSDEERILGETTGAPRPEAQKALAADELIEIQRLVRRVAVSGFVVSYVARLVRASRPHDEFAPPFINEWVEWGAGPRAGQFLILGAKALAAMEGRVAVTAADVRELVVPVLRHRIATNFVAQAEGVDSLEIIRRLLEITPEPRLG